MNLNFNQIDYIILAVIALGGLIGAYRGFIRSFFSIAKYVIIVVACKNYYKQVAILIESKEWAYDYIQTMTKGFLGDYGNIETVLQNATTVVIDVLAVILLFVLINLIMTILVAILDGIFKLGPLSGLNRLMGFIFGTIKSVVIMMFFVALLNPIIRVLPKENILFQLNESLIYKYMYMYNIFFKYLGEFFNSIAK